MQTVSRRQFLGALSVAGVGATLAACAPAAAPQEPAAPAAEGQATQAPDAPAGQAAAAGGEITAWILQGPPVEPVQELIIAELTKKFPEAKVKIEYGAGDEQKVYTNAAAGTLADVFFSADLWVVPFAKNDVSLDLKPLMEADPEVDINDIFPSMLGLGTIGGEIHMLPSSLDVVTMYYNKTMLEQAGAELPTDKWTWADVVTQGQKVTAMEKEADGTPKYWMLSHTSNGVWAWWAAVLPWVVGYGGSILDVEGKKSTFSDPKTVQAITGYTDLWVKHNIAQPLGMDLGGDSFRVGRSAIYTHIPGVRGGLRTEVADKFEWDVEVMPLMPDGKHRTGMGAWGLSANSKSKNAELAYEYVKLLVSPQIQRIMAEKEMGTPLVKSVANDTSWMEGLPKPPENVMAFVKGADDAILPVMDYPGDCGSLYAGLVNQTFTAALEAIIRGEKGVEEALKEADEIVQPCLDENWK